MIEVGEYIRTDKGKIGKVIRMGKFYNGRYDRPHYLIDWNNGKTYFMSQVKNFKHSKNIIDLIEVGDYVNGHKAVEFSYGEDDFGEIYWTLEAPYNIRTYCVGNEDIKTILTHELYEQNCYKVGDIE